MAEETNGSSLLAHIVEVVSSNEGFLHQKVVEPYTEVVELLNDAIDYIPLAVI